MASSMRRGDGDEVRRLKMPASDKRVRPLTEIIRFAAAGIPPGVTISEVSEILDRIEIEVEKIREVLAS